MDKETFEFTTDFLDNDDYEEFKSTLKRRKITQMNFPVPLKRTAEHTEYINLTKKLEENLKLFKKDVDEDGNTVYSLPQ